MVYGLLHLTKHMTLSKSIIKNKLEPLFKQHQNKLYFVYLFGSFARADSNKKSDVDLAIYFNPEYNSVDFTLILSSAISRVLNLDKVDLIILNDTKNLILAEEIIRNGILIFENNSDKRVDYELDTIHRAIDFRTQRKYVMGF